MYYFDPDTKIQRTKSSMGNAYNNPTNLYQYRQNLHAIKLLTFFNLITF